MQGNEQLHTILADLVERLSEARSMIDVNVAAGIAGNTLAGVELRLIAYPTELGVGTATDERPA